MMIKIPLKLPSLNEVLEANRANRNKGAMLKRDIESQIMWYIREEMAHGAVTPIPADLDPNTDWNQGCDVRITWVEENRKRDVDNVQSSVKFILDSLVKLCILPNDSPKYVRQIYHHVEYCEPGDEPCIFVEIVPHAVKRGGRFGKT